MQRIWILTELYYPEQTSTGYFLTKIAEGLAEEYDIKVITGPLTNYFSDVEKVSQGEVKNNVEIFRCQGTSFDKNFLLGRLTNLITRSAAILWKSLFFCKCGDIILVVTNPPLLPFASLLVKWLKGCRIVLLIHDIYPEILVATGICKPSSLIVKIGHLANRLLYNQASRIISLGKDMSQLVQSKLAGDKNKICCIPNWAENEIVSPTDRANNILLQSLGVVNRFVILYAGNIGRTHGIEYLAEAAKLLDKSTNIHFIVIGFGAKKVWLEEYVEHQKLENINILPLRPASEKVISLNACDVALISFVPGMAGVSVPSRMYNQMAAGKPIIAITEDWSELAEVVREEEIGWVVQPGDAAALIHTIQFAADNPQLCAEMGAKAAFVAQTKYTFTQVDQSYKKLFKELFSTPSELDLRRGLKLAPVRPVTIHTKERRQSRKIRSDDSGS